MTFVPSRMEAATETTPLVPRMRVWTLVESDPLRPLCPACGGGEIVRTVVGRAGEAQAEMGYCAGVYDVTRRRVVRRSCGWVGGLADP